MNSKATKRSLFASVISLMLCFSMLLGTTFAWFTDTVTSANNIIKSGNLDVAMYWAEGEEAVPVDDSADWKDASTDKIFNYENWEPGFVQVRHIKIKNAGSLALKYKVAIEADGEVSDLSDVIDVYYKDPAVQVSEREDVDNLEKLGTLTEVLAKLGETGNGELEANTADTITLAFKMQETAGNEYQNKSIGSSFAVKVYATQLTAEKDSFDETYDENAEMPWDGSIGELPSITENKLTISTAEELAAFANDVNVNKNSYSGKTVVLAAHINLNNELWTPIGQTGATQFLGTFDGQGYTISNLNIDSTANTGANYSSGLFGWLNKGTVKNLNIKNAKVSGNHNVAVIAGYLETAGCTISNCSVTNATVIARHATADACGDKVGVIVGHAGNTGVLVEKCSATDCTVTAGRDAGQIAGAAKEINVVDCAATNVTVIAGGDCTGANINEAIIGRKL